MTARSPDLRRWLTGYQAIATGYVRLADVLCRSDDCRSLSEALDITGIAQAFREDLGALENAGYMVRAGDVPVEPFENPSRTAGALWCLNGSRHGATFLVARAEARFGSQVEGFISGMERQRIGLQREQQGRSASHSIHADEPDLALEGALKTFNYFETVAKAVMEAMDELAPAE